MKSPFQKGKMFLFIRDDTLNDGETERFMRSSGTLWEGILTRDG